MTTLALALVVEGVGLERLEIPRHKNGSQELAGMEYVLKVLHNSIHYLQ